MFIIFHQFDIFHLASFNYTGSGFYTGFGICLLCAATNRDEILTIYMMTCMCMAVSEMNMSLKKIYIYLCIIEAKRNQALKFHLKQAVS